MSPISTVTDPDRTSEGGADALTAGDGVVGGAVDVGAAVGVEVGVMVDVAVDAAGAVVGVVAGAVAAPHVVTTAIVARSESRRASRITPVLRVTVVRRSLQDSAVV